MKKGWISLFTLLLTMISVMGISQKVLAFGTVVDSDNTVVISEPTDGSLFVTGETIIIEGDVNGPLFAAGQNIVVEGSINGPIFVAGNTITIEGQVDGEAFLAGNTIRTVVESHFSRDIFIAGSQIIMGASVGRDLFVGSRSTTIQNQISRNSYISTESLIFDGDGMVNGDLNYLANQEFSGVSDYVQGEVIFHRTQQQNMQRMTNRSPFSILLRVIGSIVSALFVWLFFRGVTHERWIRLSPHLINRPIMLVFIGLGLSLLIPILIVLSLFLTVFRSIGTFLGILFILLLFLSKIVTASVLGEYVFKHRIPIEKYQDLIGFIIAYGLLLITSYIPVLGWLISLFCIFYTVGLAFRETISRFETRSI